tara:strand:- start:322 stop:876 length:555 start_codon:yes stop_codon:yes gene_type:complete
MEWVKIESLSFMYEASKDGSLRSIDRFVKSKPKGVEFLRKIKGKLLSSFDNGNGYQYVTTSVDGVKRNKYVHRLIAEAFCLRSSGCNEVNHINGDKSDNIFKNLEWVTSKENSVHASLNNLLKKGSNHYKFISPIQSQKEGFGVVMFGKKHINSSGFSSSCVYNCLNGKASKHKGFTFERITSE